jgi:hypothetical protein
MGRFDERQELLDRALAIEPQLAEAHGLRGEFLADVGYMSEALASYRHAAARDPLSPSNMAMILPALSANGHSNDVRLVRERFSRIWPDSPSAWFQRFNSAAFTGEPDEALAILSESSPALMEEPMRDAWRRYLFARRSRDRDAVRLAARHMDALARRGEFDKQRAIAAMAFAGELDAAFALADAYFADPHAESFPLFVPSTAAMRRDRRFMTLARRIGLVAYWTHAGRWPDFCAAADLPYSCSAEVAQAAARSTNLGGGPSGKLAMLECPDGYLVGFRGRRGAWLAQIGPLCAPWRSDQNRFGEIQADRIMGDSPGGYAHRATCPPGMAIRSLRIFASHDQKNNPVYVAFVEAQCAAIGRGEGRATLEFGFRPRTKLGSPFFPVERRRFFVSCAKGEFATGLIGRADFYVDALGLACKPAPRSQSAGAARQGAARPTGST